MPIFMVRHMKTLTIIVAILIASNIYSNECEITGKTILWAYDACLWEFETDDTLHPGVIECVKKSENFMMTVSECEAKITFKRKICVLAKEYKAEGIDQETCMSKDKALGPSVRNGGI